MTIWSLSSHPNLESPFKVSQTSYKCLSCGNLISITSNTWFRKAYTYPSYSSLNLFYIHIRRECMVEHHSYFILCLWLEAVSSTAAQIALLEKLIKQSFVLIVIPGSPGLSLFCCRHCVAGRMKLYWPMVWIPCRKVRNWKFSYYLQFPGAQLYLVTLINTILNKKL